MSDSKSCLQSMKVAAKKLQAAQANADMCSHRQDMAFKELQEARSQYNVVVQNLRAQVDLEVTQDMTDAEFIKNKGVPHA